MTNEYQQKTNLVKSKDEKVENLSYQEVNKIKLKPEENNSTSIAFNTQSILSKLIDYSNAYIQFQFDVKFETDDICTKNKLTLKKSYEMISELKIALNNIIVSNEHDTNYSYIINHLLENSNSDNLISRTINIHSNFVECNNTNKDIFLTKMVIK